MESTTIPVVLFGSIKVTPEDNPRMGATVDLSSLDLDDDGTLYLWRDEADALIRALGGQA